MARPKAKAPARRYHLSGQSVVTINRTDFYLGPHDSPEAIARYAVLIAQYQAGGMKLPAGFELSSLDPQVAAILGTATGPRQQAVGPITVKHVTACFRERIKERYSNSPQERHRLNQVCDALDKHEGDKPAKSFGPLALQRQRKRWIDSGMSRKYVNRLVQAIRRVFKYAISQELIKQSVLDRLKAVEPLRYGEAKRETKKVKPVQIEVVRKTAKYLSPVLRAMVRIQVATGMRPVEICRMRPMDIDRTGPVWFYRPTMHKTAWQGIEKAVPIIGDAREAVEDYLNRPAERCCFSPAESIAWYRAMQRAKRKSKVQPSQQHRRKERPGKAPRDHFDANSYRQSLQRAAIRAGVPHWFPYQIRHLSATVINEALGIDPASALLGHANVEMTRHYAKLTEAKAVEAAKAAPKL